MRLTTVGKSAVDTKQRHSRSAWRTSEAPFDGDVHSVLISTDPVALTAMTPRPLAHAT